METIAQHLAAAALAGAVAFAVENIWSASLYAIGAAFAVYFVCSFVLNRLTGPQVRMKVPVFDLREFEPIELDELLLTERVHDELLLTQAERVESELVLSDSDRLDKPTGVDAEPLILDDVLAAAGTESRVVRLFDRRATLSAEQRRSTAQRELSQVSSAPGRDASEALSEALEELRRSLR